MPTFYILLSRQGLGWHGVRAIEAATAAAARKAAVAQGLAVHRVVGAGSKQAAALDLNSPWARKGAINNPQVL